MRPLQQGATATTVIALVGVLGGVPASAQEPQPRAERLGDSIERTIEAFARVVEHNAERWAEAIERHAERVAVIVEAEAAGQSEAARERAREQRERQQEQARDARERGRRQGRDGREQTEQISRTSRLSRGGIVDIETLSGDITITGGSGSDVQIQATKRVRAQDDARGRELLAELRVEVTERPGRVEIRAIHPRGGPRNTSAGIDFTLSVPNGADVFVKTFSGDVRVTNIRGELRAETMSGDITVADASRVHTAKTMSGDLQITDAEGEISGGTMSGDVIIRNVKGRSLNVNTTSGDLMLTGIDVERADVGSINGTIDYSGRLQKGGRYQLHTHSGDVRLTPTTAQGFDVEARTLNGDIVSQYQMKLSQESEAGGRRGPSRSIRGTFGDAGAFLSLQSFNGDITIVRK